MHILINGWFWNRPETGSGQYLRHLITTFAEQQVACDISVALPAHIPPPPPLGSITFHTLPAWPNNVGKLLWEQVTIPRIAHHKQADVLHIPYWGSPLFSSTPVVVTVHDLIPLLLPGYQGGFLGKLYTQLVCITTKRVKSVITDSAASRHDIVQHLHLPSAQVQTIHLAAAPTYQPETSVDDARILNDLGIRPGYVLYLGGFDTRKNVQAVCDIFAQLLSFVPNAQLVIAGKLPANDTNFAPDPRRLVKEANIPASSITFTGFVPDAHTPVLYRGARAFIFPSTFEGFGLPPLEALSCGVPVIASNATSLPEVVGDAQMLFTPNDIKAMAKALQHLLTDDAFYQKKRQRALQQATQFSWSRTAELTLATYRATIN